EPAARAASSTRTVPTTLTAASWSGRRTEVWTSACAARWNTTSAAPASIPSRMSPSTNLAAGWRKSRLPEERSSTTTTSSPRPTSASTRLDPMKPAPPVTTARTASYRKHCVFITFEGQDWSGKSTQAALLAQTLGREGRDVVSTREPGGTPVGEAIRALVLDGPEMSAWAEGALFAAARAEHVAAVIRPALGRGAAVVCDRYVDSSVVYQGIARGLGAERVLELNLAVTGGLLPDRTFVLDVDPGTARARHSAGL